MVKLLSRVRLFVTRWTVAHQAPPSMGFSRQEYWNGLPLPSPGDFTDPGIEPKSPALWADALTSEPPGKQFQSKNVSLSVVSHSVTSWTIVHQAPSAHGIRQAGILEWVAISLSPEDLANLGIEPRSLALRAFSLLSEPPSIEIVPLQ